MFEGVQLFGTREKTIDYYDVRKKEDPFPNASTLDPLDVDRKDEIDAGITKMLEDDSDNGLRAESKDELQRLVTNNVDVFRTSFCLIFRWKSSCYVSTSRLT